MPRNMFPRPPLHCCARTHIQVAEIQIYTISLNSATKLMRSPGANAYFCIP